MKKTQPFRPEDYLESPEDIALYLEEAAATGDPGAIARAREVAAKARARIKKEAPPCPDST